MCVISARQTQEEGLRWLQWRTADILTSHAVSLLQHLCPVSFSSWGKPPVLTSNTMKTRCVPSKCLTLPTKTWWTVAHQAVLSMGFSRQEYGSRLSFPSPRDLPNPGIKPVPPALAGRFFTTEPPGKPTLRLTYNPIRALTHINLFNVHSSPGAWCYIHHSTENETEEIKVIWGDLCEVRQVIVWHC